MAANTIQITILVTNKGSRNLGNVSKSLSGLSGVAKVATGVFAGLTAGLALAVGGLVAFGASAVKEGAAYTKAMSNVKAITGATAVEFEALSASAEELGRKTKFTSTEVASGMSFMAMAGFEVNEIIGAMPGVLNLAAAGNLDLAKSADIVSNVLTGFGEGADQTGRFVDVLTKTFVSSNTNLIQLGQAMKFVAPVAADLDLSVEQLAAAMGTLGDGGIQASMAGTTMRTVLLNLTAPVGKAKGLIKELGIEIFDAEGKMLPFPEIIGNFSDAMVGMSDAQRQSTLRTIIGKRAISGFSLLLKKGEKGLEDFGQELIDSGGTAAKIAATQLDNLSGDVTLFKSVLSGIKIDVFKALEPVLRGIVAQGKILLETFGPQLQVILGNVTKTIEGLISAFQAGGVGGAFGALFSPEAAGVALQGVIDFITQFLADNWPIVQAQLTEWGNMFFDWVNTTVIPNIPEFLTGIITAITTWASEQLPIIQATTQEWATGFWDWIQTVVDSAGESLAGIIASIGLWAQSGETQGQLTEMGFALGEAIVLGIQNMAENQERMVEILTQVVTGLAIGTAAVVGLLIAIGAQIVAGIIAGIIESITGGDVEVAMITNLGTMLADIGSQILTIASLIGTNIILGISQGILDTISELTTTLQQIGTIISETVKSALGISSPSTLFFGFGIDIIQGLIDGILSLAASLPDILGGVAESISGIFSGLFGGGEEAQAPTMTFDPAEMLAGMESVNIAIEGVNLSLTNISTITIPFLQASFLVMTTAMIEQLLLLLNTGIMPVDVALVLMTTVTLPNLQTTAIAVAASIVAAFIPVQEIISIITGLVITLTATLVTMGKNALKAGEDTAKGMGKAKDKIDNLIQTVKRAVTSFEKLTSAMNDAASAAQNVGAASGDAGGQGFQHGTPPGGFVVPPGFNNDNFVARFSTGERIFAFPRGQSPGGNVTNIYNSASLTVNTRAQASTVIGDMRVLQSMLGT